MVWDAPGIMADQSSGMVARAGRGHYLAAQFELGAAAGPITARSASTIASTFDQWTLDGDYLFNNCEKHQNVCTSC